MRLYGTTPSLKESAAVKELLAVAARISPKPSAQPNADVDDDGAPSEKRCPAWARPHCPRAKMRRCWNWCTWSCRALPPHHSPSSSSHVARAFTTCSTSCSTCRYDRCGVRQLSARQAGWAVRVVRAWCVRVACRMSTRAATNVLYVLLLRCISLLTHS